MIYLCRYPWLVALWMPPCARPTALHPLHAIFIPSVRVPDTSHAHAGDYTLQGAASSGSLIGKGIEGADRFAGLLNATYIAAAARCRGGACRAVPAEQAVVAPQRGEVLQVATATSKSAAAAADVA
jgi:hypothetical protein